MLDHLTDEQKPLVAKKLNAAYALEDYAEAKNALNTLHRELMDLNPSAARSLGEGLEETLTVHRLHVPHLQSRALVRWPQDRGLRLSGSFRLRRCLSPFHSSVPSTPSSNRT